MRTLLALLLCLVAGTVSVQASDYDKGVPQAVEQTNQPQGATQDDEGVKQITHQLINDIAYRQIQQGIVDNAIRESLRSVMTGVLAWSIDHTSADDRKAGRNVYPDSIDQVVVGGYLPNLTTHDVPFGWTQASAANFTYLKQYDASGKVVYFKLVAYGSSAGAGPDLNGDGMQDGIIAVMSPGLTHEESGSEYYSHGEKIRLSPRQ